MMRRGIWATITTQVVNAQESDEPEDLIVSLSDQAFCNAVAIGRG